MKKILVAALALLMLSALVGCAFDNASANGPSVTASPMPDMSDGTVKDNDGYIGNENVSDPAGDAAPENKLPDTATPDITAPGAIKPDTTAPNTDAPDMMSPEQSPKP